MYYGKAMGSSKKSARGAPLPPNLRQRKGFEE
jgi:hypothetical protein